MKPQLEQIRDQQKQRWNKFSPGWKKWDALLMQVMKPIGDAIIEILQITDDDMVLDIAAGTGEPGLTIAGIAKNGKVVGTDLSEDMLIIANDHAVGRGLKNYCTKVADVCELPFEDNTFSAISCRMGFMFFPDMQLAANEMYRVLKPGGRIASSVWAAPEQNFWRTGLTGIIKKYVEIPPSPPEAPGMFRCSKPGCMTNIFMESGFKAIKEQGITGKFDYIDTETYWAHTADCNTLVIEIMANPDDTVKAAIKTEVYALINTNSANGRALLDFGAKIIYGEK
jgi:ubiquinone/menaquinone biosynthesis C-methylase UbiE